jgi:hypothetical protein
MLPELHPAGWRAIDIEVVGSELTSQAHDRWRSVKAVQRHNIRACVLAFSTLIDEPLLEKWNSLGERAAFCTNHMFVSRRAA